MFRLIRAWLERLRRRRPAPDDERFAGEGWTPELIEAYKRMIDDLMAGR